MTTAVRDIADEYTRALAAREPSAALALRRERPDRALADLSPEWLEERYALQGDVLDQLAALPDDAPDGVLRAALVERLSGDRAMFDTGFTMRMAAGLASPMHLIVEGIEGLVIGEDAGGIAVLERLEAAPAAVHEYMRSLSRARELGRAGRFSGTSVASVRQIGLLADQAQGWADTDYFGGIERAEGLAPELAARADAAAAAMAAALGDLVRFLRDDLLPDAPAEDAMGEDVYDTMVASMLGTPVDLAEVYAFGWSELERLVALSRELAVQLGGSGDDPVRSAAALLDADPRYRLEGIDEIVAWLRARVAESAEVLGAEAFDIPPTIEDVECVVSQASSGVVYYTPAPPDGSVPSRIVWTIPSGVPRASTWQEVTSVHHEGLPGHHLEHTINRANADLHPWQRYLCEVHGYAEGWAHYAEALSDELGLIRDPAERLGMVLGQIWRSVRIVADIGMHTAWPIPRTPLTTETVWTPELAQAFLEDFAMVEPDLARFEVDRYLGIPGQALAFKVGAKLWMEARQAWRARRGADAPLADFHREALALGPMGLAPLRTFLLAG
ncbi:DUF885 domain-containing protein [Microbacterium rhizomatis]|uniref:DUF885 domain-containing protein n=1 Tax=Microbacterium rhizomatis TaxID=1631477 RepID=A0A5J5IYT2_9MICO|nr:DUF885 domain-containing protein [Microbacterium rhizomatis]KAA9106575.1 DUF885 domain-containing protein [Microbacterium rhizomatis]